MNALNWKLGIAEADRGSRPVRANRGHVKIVDRVGAVLGPAGLDEPMDLNRRQPDRIGECEQWAVAHLDAHAVKLWQRSPGTLP